MLTFILANGLEPKNVLDSSIDIKGLNFSLVGGLDTWSVWVQSEKLVCLAWVDLSDCDTAAWWDVPDRVRRELLDYEYCVGTFTRLWESVDSPLVIYD